MKKPTITSLKKKLWQECRRLIKEQHPHYCYTCGMQLEDGSANFHVGHFIPSSISSVAMRYDLDNLRPQCSGCNIWRSGDWVSYEKHLKNDGIDVEELKQRNEKTKGKRYDILWYQDKLEEYKNI